MTRAPSLRLKDRWLDALLPHVVDEGWTPLALDVSAREIGLSSGEQALAAPGGVVDLIDHFFIQAEDCVREQASEGVLGGLRTHERVARGVRIWLDALEPNREAVRRAAARGLLPWQSAPAIKRGWSVADTIWLAAGDTATDYNKQTKRILLSGALPAILSYWLNDPSSDDLDAYIARRLQGAMKLGQASGKVLSPALDFMERIRPSARRS